MRIYLLSNYSGIPDEGFKNVALKLDQELSHRHSVVHKNALHSLSSPGFWLGIKRFRPQIVHIFLRPSPATLLMARTLKLYLGDSKIIISALQPPLRYRWIKSFKSWLRPDLTLTSCKKTQEMCRALGWQVSALPCGVDSRRFSPPDLEIRRKLRDKYGVDRNKFVVLHVGPIRRNRNLPVLARIQGQNGVQVIVVANTSFPAHKEICSVLEQAGCVIWRRYVENLEEVYGLADCYVFPAVDDSSCIEVPLSVMEAMACNLPVITSRFGSLPQIFSANNGLYFAGGDGDFPQLLARVRSGEAVVGTRQMVMPYAWEAISRRLEEIYADIIGQR